MKIAFVHNSKAFIPEIDAYIKYFQSIQIDCEVVSDAQQAKAKFDIEWHFMGIDWGGRNLGKIKIHEYCSASTPPFSSLKNQLKKTFNKPPHFRIFLNPYVKDVFSFKDTIPFGFRDMGISNEWLKSTQPASAPLFDFVYIGDLSTSRKPEQLLQFFTTGSLKNQSLLVIGSHYKELQDRYASFENIHFEGPYPHSEMLTHIRKAKFGINFIPDIEPYNQQTSTKFLEYAAAGIPIVSSDYHWVRAFQQKYGGRYFFLPSNEELQMDTINHFNFEQPDLNQWIWEEQIKRSGVTEFIQKMCAKMP